MAGKSLFYGCKTTLFGSARGVENFCAICVQHVGNPDGYRDAEVVMMLYHLLFHHLYSVLHTISLSFLHNTKDAGPLFCGERVERGFHTYACIRVLM